MSSLDPESLPVLAEPPRPFGSIRAAPPPPPASVGAEVGSAIGEKLGKVEGVTDGDRVGVTDGDRVGADAVGIRDGIAVGAAVGLGVGTAVGSTVVGAGLGGLVGTTVGDRVFHSQVWLAVSQSGAQWCVATQLQRKSAPLPICSQIPKAVVSQPCDPSLQACRVGAAVGSAVGAGVGARDGGVDGARLGALVGGSVVVVAAGRQTIPDTKGSLLPQPMSRRLP